MDILLAIAIMALGAIVLGAALGFAAIKFKVEGDPLVEKIEAILPQTQCGQCGFPGCKPYAEAIVNGEEINKCPPGGAEGVQRLADLLGREVKPLDAEEKPKQIAIIDENTCIGCTLCIQACPVDAIVGAAKQMHTIITQQCTDEFVQVQGWRQAAEQQAAIEPSADCPGTDALASGRTAPSEHRRHAAADCSGG